MGQVDDALEDAVRAWHARHPGFVDDRVAWPLLGRQQPLTYALLLAALALVAAAAAAWRRFEPAARRNVNVHPPDAFAWGNSNWFFQKDYRKIFKQAGVANPGKPKPTPKPKQR